MARQLLRWAIPGWLFILFVLVFMTVHIVFLGRFPSINNLLGQLSIVRLEGLIALGGGGIPLGFLIYQVYFWFVWHGIIVGRTVIFPWHEDPFDRGWRVLRGLGPDDPKINEMTKRLVGDQLMELPALEPSAPRTGFLRTTIPIFYKVKFAPGEQRLDKDSVWDNRHHNYVVAESIWYLIVDEFRLTNSAVKLVWVHEVFDALGSCLVSAWLAFLMYVSYLVYRSLPSLQLR